jgi:NAD(P)-dependent dehydrogenase (short-subunit alcohol dehydrogenase family)
VRCDITQATDVRNLVELTMTQWGRIDVLVNNAGITWAFGLLETPPAKWNEIMRTNVDGLYLCSIAVAPHMIEGGGGSIINISSGRGHSEDARSIAYAASKAAVTRLSIKFAAEMKPHNVAVNVLDPGATLVERASTGSDRSGWKRPEEKQIIPACIFLAQQRGDGLTGHELNEAEYGVSWP